MEKLTCRQCSAPSHELLCVKCYAHGLRILSTLPEYKGWVKVWQVKMSNAVQSAQ